MIELPKFYDPRSLGLPMDRSSQGRGPKTRAEQIIAAGRKRRGEDPEVLPDDPIARGIHFGWPKTKG